MILTRLQSEILARLRNERMRYYIEALRRLADEEGNFNKLIEDVRSLDEQHGHGTEQFTPLHDAMLDPSYHELIDCLSEYEPDISEIVHNLLVPVAVEERLAKLKSDNFESYLSTLREIPEKELIEALENGTVVNATDEFGSPLEIPSDESVSGSFLASPTPTAKVTAATLRKVLHQFTAEGDFVSDPRGLRLRRVYVIDQLNLNWMSLKFPLAFQGCAFTNWIWADNLSIPALFFEACDFDPIFNVIKSSGSFTAAKLNVEGPLRILSCRKLGQLSIPNSRIGEFELTPPEVLEESGQSFNTYMDGSHIGKLYVGSRDTTSGKYELPKDISIGRIVGDTSDVIDWLRGGQPRPALFKRLPSDQGAHERVWQATADALSRSGRKADATEVRVEYHRFRAQTRSPLVRLFSWLFADVTVHYFHRPARALSLLAFVFAITWIIAFSFQDDLIQSPLANDTVPAGWLQEMMSSAAWSFMYALDSTFSPLSLGQIEVMWPNSVWLALALALLKGIGVVLLGLFIGSATTLVSKRSAE